MSTVCADVRDAVERASSSKRLSSIFASAGFTPAIASGRMNYGGGTGEHPMGRLPHFSHASAAQSLDQSIAAELACPRDVGAQVVDHAGAGVGHSDADQVGQA